MFDTPDPIECQRKAESLLREAAQTANLAERSRLIDQATHWHFRAPGPHHDAETDIPSISADDEGPADELPHDGG